MALLGTFVNAGIACLSGGLNCFLHGIVGFQASPDSAIYQVRGSTVAGVTNASFISIPIALESIGDTTIIWRNYNGAPGAAAAGVRGEHLVVMWHGIIR